MLRRLSLAALAVALVATGSTAGQNPKFVVGQVMLGFDGTLTRAELKCVGGEPTGLEFPSLPCTEGTRRVFIRSEVQTWSPVSSSSSVEDLLTPGTITLVANCNFNSEYRGPCWGTFTWDVEGVGTWEGQVTSPLQDLMTYESRFSMVGFGRGGAIDGKQLKFDGGSAPFDYYITGTVRIH
jgi:hypothetical protein